MTTEIIDVQFPGGKRVDTRVGEFLIQTDQSQKHGGDASAPEPFALFASIASCAGIFASVSARNRSCPPTAWISGWSANGMKKVL